MSNPDLRTYLDSLDSRDMVRVEDAVPRDYVITALCTELDRQRAYPVLLFPHVKGYDIPIVTNLFGRRERILAMMGATQATFSQRWLAAEKGRVKPRIVRGGEVQERILTGDGLDVRSLPIMRHFKTDGGRYVTAAFVVAKDPHTGVRNLSFHRLQVKTADKMGISLHSRQHLWTYFMEAEKLGRPLEVAAVIGAHPLVVLAASAKTGIEVDEYDIAGSLLGEPLELVAGQTVDVEYPANAEIVIEGKILPQVYEDEGPFGEYTGYSTSRSTRNVFEVSAVCMRDRPTYLSVVASASADHLNLMRVAKEALVWDRLKERVTNVRAIHYAKSGVNFHCVVSMAPGAAGSVRQALMLLFGLDPYLKLIIAVDEDIDITDEQAVMWALATRMQGDRDMFVVPGVFTNRLDPSSAGGVGAKVGIDATRDPDSDAIMLALDPEHEKEAGRLARQVLKDFHV